MSAGKAWTFKGETPQAESSTQAEPDPKLLEEIERQIRRYVILPPHAYLPAALWTIATHAVETFDCFPYIAAVSATKRSGKTRLAEVLELIVRRPWRGTAPSPAALYRMLEGAPTLLLDETEALNGKSKSETTLILLAVLNAGHRKGSTIPRCDGPRQEVRQFPVYGPKFFAAIGRLPDTLLDRSILIHMKRRVRTQTVERFRMKRATEESKPIQKRAADCVKTHADAIESAYQKVLETDLTFLNDRDADLWTPLFTICLVVSPERRAELEKCALVLSAAKSGDDVDDSVPLALLRDIQAVWPAGEEKCESTRLLERLKALEDSPWDEQPKPLTARKLARMLRPFEVEPRNIQVGSRRPKGYYFEDLKDAFDRYLDEKCATSATNQ
ncbi:MAG TPA: DUF3631 domain-containing protein [Bryobacteraceae bacterium]|jgi:hypothetical protein